MNARSYMTNFHIGAHILSSQVLDDGVDALAVERKARFSRLVVPSIVLVSSPAENAIQNCATANPSKVFSSALGVFAQLTAMSPRSEISTIYSYHEYF